MRFISGPLTVLTLLLTTTTTSSLAQSKAVLLNKAQVCTDLSKLQEPVITFGQETSHAHSLGQIYSQGQVTMLSLSPATRLPFAPNPEVLVEATPISPLTVQALVSLADAKGFWNLPSSDAGSSIDAKGFFLPNNKNFITIHLPCKSRTVAFKIGTAPQQFTELYSLLQDLIRE
ncbi:MAG TPA: hypothetical protein V6D16_03325 [Candidatus Obscuribacterales bacterium]